MEALGYIGFILFVGAGAIWFFYRRRKGASGPRRGFGDSRSNR